MFFFSFSFFHFFLSNVDTFHQTAPSASWLSPQSSLHLWSFEKTHSCALECKHRIAKFDFGPNPEPLHFPLALLSGLEDSLFLHLN